MAVFKQLTANAVELSIRAKGIITSLVQPLLFNVQALQRDTPDRFSDFFGTPVLGSMLFPRGAYIDLVGNTIAYPDLNFNEAIVEVNKTNNIESTPLPGRDGTIKEYISASDYQITVNALLVGDGEQSPYDLVTTCNSVFSATQAIEVYNDLLIALDVTTVVIQSVTYRQNQAFSNVLGVTITMTSDKNVNLEENATT